MIMAYQLSLHLSLQSSANPLLPFELYVPLASKKGTPRVDDSHLILKESDVELLGVWVGTKPIAQMRVSPRLISVLHLDGWALMMKAGRDVVEIDLPGKTGFPAYHFFHGDWAITQANVIVEPPLLDAGFKC